MSQNSKPEKAGKVIHPSEAIKIKEKSNFKPGKVISKEVYDAHQRAKEIIQVAEAEANQIIRSAEEHARGLAGEIQGRQEDAIAQGREAGIAKVTEALLKVQELEQSILTQAEPQLLQLAMEISRKIIQRELHSHPQTTLEIVRAHIGKLKKASSIILRVNPEDFKALQRMRPELEAMFSHQQAIQIMEDENIEQGGCILETDVGTFDASLEAQFKAIKECFNIPGEETHE